MAETRTSQRNTICRTTSTRAKFFVCALIIGFALVVFFGSVPDSIGDVRQRKPNVIATWEAATKLTKPTPAAPVAGEQTGVCVQWNIEKGFGFIQPNEGGDNLFFHLSGLVQGPGSVQVGDQVAYALETNERTKKAQATKIRSLGGGSGPPPSSFIPSSQSPKFTSQQFTPVPGALSGTLMNWNHEKGYGFVEPSDGGTTLFVHLSGLVDGPGSVHRGDKVTFIKEINDRTGREQAAQVRGSGGLSRLGPAIRRQPFTQPMRASGNFMFPAQDPTRRQQSGTITQWQADKGYGFIQPFDGSENVFCHLSAFVNGVSSVQVGDQVTYLKEFNKRTGKLQASTVHLASGPGGPGSSDFVDPTTQRFGGTVVVWNDEKGFGFIKPTAGGENVFCHLSALADGPGGVQVETKVTFLKEFSSRTGRFQASDVKVGTDLTVPNTPTTAAPSAMTKAAVSGGVAPAAGTAALSSKTAAAEESEKGEQRGTMTRWNSEKGYGFVQPDSGGDALFCHVSSFLDGPKSLKDSDKVTYLKRYHEQKKKYQAVDIRKRAAAASGAAGPVEGGEMAGD